MTLAASGGSSIPKYPIGASEGLLSVGVGAVTGQTLQPVYLISNSLITQAAVWSVSCLVPSLISRFKSWLQWCHAWGKGNSGWLSFTSAISVLPLLMYLARYCPTDFLVLIGSMRVAAR